MKNPHGRRRCVVLGPRCITRSPRKRSTSHGGRSAGGRYSLAGRRSLAESRPSFLRDELRGRGPVRLGGDAATLPAASGEATAKEAAANSVSLAGRAARRRQKQCAHFPRPCPSGVDEKPGYKRRLPSRRECKPTQEKKEGRPLLRWATSPYHGPLSRTHRSTASLSLPLATCDGKPEPGTQGEKETALHSSLRL